MSPKKFIFKVEANRLVLLPDTAEEFIKQFCSTNLLTQDLTLQECMDDYAAIIKISHGIDIPTDSPKNFINKLVRLGYIKWVNKPEKRN